ncbi:MAG: hypothetical protein K9K21_01340 [Desulfotignum sp.]|nr:hypothetical protein [Desulfotignum sp.]
MKKRETTVFSCGNQVEHAVKSIDEVVIDHNSESIQTTDKMIEDVLQSVFYALVSYKDQVGHMDQNGEEAATDIYFVLDSLLSHAQDRMNKIINAIERHLGGRVFFLEPMPGQLTIKNMKAIGDIAGIMVRKRDNEAHNNVEMEKESAQ